MKKTYNEKIIDDLAEMEYAIRDGLVLTEKQKVEIALICEQIIANVS